MKKWKRNCGGNHLLENDYIFENGELLKNFGHETKK